MIRNHSYQAHCAFDIGKKQAPNIPSLILWFPFLEFPKFLVFHQLGVEVKELGFIIGFDSFNNLEFLCNERYRLINNLDRLNFSKEKLVMRA